MIQNQILRLLNTFNSILNTIIFMRVNYTRNPEKDFIKKGPLTFSVVLKLVFMFEEKSIRKLLNHPEKINQVTLASTSALSQARKKILLIAFQEIFSTFNRQTRRNRYFKEFLLFAFDGSEATIYGRTVIARVLEKYLGKSKRGYTRHFVHINACFDVLERTFVDFLLQPGSEKNERKAFLEQIRELAKTYPNFIAICDRGYESAMLFYILCKLKVHFVIRIKDQEENDRALMANYPERPDTEEYDIPFHAVLGKNSKRAKLEREAGKPLKYLKIQDLDQKPEYAREFEGTDYLFLDCRVVRLKVYKADGSFIYETLMTNLPEEKISINDLSYIYRMRWATELGFEGLKYDLFLEKMSSRNAELVHQEIYAKTTLFNLCARILNIVEDEKLEGLDAILHQYFTGYEEGHGDAVPDTFPVQMVQEDAAAKEDPMTPAPESDAVEEDAADTAAESTDVLEEVNESSIDTEISEEEKQEQALNESVDSAMAYALACINLIDEDDYKYKRVYGLSFSVTADLVLSAVFTSYTLESVGSMIEKIAKAKNPVQLRRPDTRSKKSNDTRSKKPNDTRSKKPKKKRDSQVTSS